MRRYRVVTVDPLNTEGKWVVPGTYTLESARRMVNLHRKLAGGREASIEETEPRKQRHPYYAELTFDSGLVRRQWIREYPPEKAVQQTIRRMGSRLTAVRLWWCRDDYELGDPPLLEYRRMGGMFRKVG